MTHRTLEQVMAELADLLRNFEGKEYSGEIGPKTQFFNEMGFASIDAVVLGEKLEDFYGCKLPFHLFIADLRERNVEDIEVGELAAFIQRHLESATPGS